MRVIVAQTSDAENSFSVWETPTEEWGHTSTVYGLVQCSRVRATCRIFLDPLVSAYSRWVLSDYSHRWVYNGGGGTAGLLQRFRNEVALVGKGWPEILSAVTADAHPGR